MAVPLAGAMNGIKGEVNTLNGPPGLAGRPGPGPVPEQRRPPDAGGDARGLPGLAFPDFRRYLRAKARLLGQERLPWWDLFAPVVGEEGRVWPFDEAAASWWSSSGPFRWPGRAGAAGIRGALD